MRSAWPRSDTARLAANPNACAGKSEQPVSAPLQPLDPHFIEKPVIVRV